VYARAQIQIVPGNYNWNTNCVQMIIIIIIIKKSEIFQKISQKKNEKKMGHSSGCADSRTV
jgi:hypothetical protein